MNALTQPLSNAVAVLQDQKASGTAGGTFTSGAWQTRTLNTEVIDTKNIVTLAANQFTLLPGFTYLIEAEATAQFCGLHQARIQNITDGATVSLGLSSQNNTSTTTTTSRVSAIFTPTANKALELQHRCQTTRATDGWGSAGSFGIEVYSQITITRL